MLLHMQRALRPSHRCLAQRRRCSSGGPAPPAAAADEEAREYFHYLNDHGNLYHLYDVPAFLRGDVPSGPAHIREAKLLRMFHHLLKPNQTGTHPEFPWLSLCRGERNFLKASDRPVVFTEIAHDGAEGTAQLLYGGDTLSLPFEPGRLVVCSEGRIYHPSRRGLGGLGLLSCHVALRLGLDSIYDDDCAEEPYLVWHGAQYPIGKIDPFPAKFL